MIDEIDYDELFEKIAILRENFNDSQKAIIDDFFKKNSNSNRSSKQLIFNRLDAQPTGISKISLHIIIRIKLIRGKK
ncbi:hypothetical protein [Aliarcobacter cryaerophilus]|uniref:hypothetical protein n=1 Tax=Aliarcobacter cryaerophilus TaxID=28198 RepID=UPI0021B4FE48|nr:hypothetical protein [Aliarcobacter cryaerophilus]MCT7517103.1 hypothetical protein [Aliarcobacter cryaerophilus]